MISIYGERFEDTDFAGTPRVYQTLTFGRDTKLKALRTKFVHYNSPSFTTLGMRVYTGLSGPTDLKASFDKLWTPAEIYSMPYGFKEIYFDFNNPLWLKADTPYHFVPWVVDPAFTGLSHLSWVRGFPDPNVVTATQMAVSHVGRVPFYMGVIGADHYGMG